MRSISFTHTERQFLNGTKTVTRRLGWLRLKAGDYLQAVRQVQGLKRGQKLHVLGVIVVLGVRREPLDSITRADCAREGFPKLSPDEFVSMFRRLDTHAAPDEPVTRIEFRRIS